MVRASGYLAAAAIIWFVEGFLFSQLLHFSRMQTVAAACVYALLFATALTTLIRMSRKARDTKEGLPLWRHLSLAPMLVATLGSFASLPILLAILILGRVL